jgi:tRNA threonylcarbamoyl adenosine modification protein YeaZ
VEEAPCVVLAADGKVLASRSAQGAAAAMGFLAPAVAGVLSEAGTDPGGLGGVACVRGPGSFTGIRVSLALALGLRLGAGTPLWGLDALPLGARRAFAVRPQARRAAVAMHARRGLVYFQIFRSDACGGVAAEAPALVLTAEDAAGMAGGLFPESFPGEAVVIGSGMRNNRAVFAARLPESCLAPDEAVFPDAAVLAAAATGPSRDAPRPAEPAYLRPSDAEENLATISRNQGLDPETAKALLAAAQSAAAP